MFMFLTAELTAIGQVLGLPAFGGTPAWIAILATAVATVGYTAYGGLVASLRTDQWKGWLILGLMTIGLGAILFDLENPVRTAVDGGLTRVDRSGAETVVVLLVAVTAANLFHQGYWQRMWAAADERVLRSATAVEGYDVLRLFLIADLVAAATVVPVFLPLFPSLGRRVTGAGAIAGSVAGLVAVFVLGVVTRAGESAMVSMAQPP